MLVIAHGPMQAARPLFDASPALSTIYARQQLQLTELPSIDMSLESLTYCQGMEGGWQLKRLKRLGVSVSLLCLKSEGLPFPPCQLNCMRASCHACSPSACPA